MSYTEKLNIADNYLFDIVGIGWNDLSDINSLHDCECIEDIHEYCNDRVNDIMG